MRSKFGRAMQKGFTLIELLIVVIIVAILAAIVVPQFNNTSLEAKEATLDANLAAIRSAIELYKLQHDVYPGETTAVPTSTCGDVAGTGSAGSEAAFLSQLTMATDKKGGACSSADAATFKYGPYLRTGMPNEPINGIATVVVSATGKKIVVATTATGGWAYDTKTGQFIMNSSAQDSSKTKLYSAH